MKKKLYLFVVLLVILLVILFSLARNRIKDATYIVLFGSEKQKKTLYTPLVYEKFDFSKLGNRKAYKIYPKYFGIYIVSVKITDDYMGTTMQEMNEYALYFADCIKVNISVEDKIIYNKTLREEDLFGNGYSLKAGLKEGNMGVILYIFRIENEDLNREITLELEIVNTNENLIKYVNKKTLLVEAGGNL